MPGRFLNTTTAVFASIVVIVVVWIGSGMIGREAAAPPQRTAPPPPVVAASTSQARDVTTELRLYGDVEPVQIATIRARTDGVVETVVSQGHVAALGDELANLSTDDRTARRVRAEAQVTTAQQAYDAAQQLFARGAGPEVNVQRTLAELEAARAELRAVELDLANTVLTAPIAGTVSRIIADLGAYVAAGGEVMEIVDNDPLLAVVHVQQHQISRIRRDMPAQVSFIGGEKREGRVSFVSPIANAATRTFRVEVEVTNPDGTLPSGISAEVVIPVETIAAHYLSPALLRLDDRGEMGLFIVDDEDRVQFTRIDIVNADAGGIWVRGIGDRARVVAISRGTLASGQTVEVKETPAGYLTGETEDDETTRSTLPNGGNGGGPSDQEGANPAAGDAR